MIRVLYITSANLLFRRGHVRNIIKTADALNKTGEAEVRVVSSHGGEWRKLLLWQVVEERKNFDILYFRDPKLIMPVLAARFLGKKIAFEIHGSEEWRFLSWLWRFSFRVSDGAVFITRELTKWYKPGEKPFVVTHVNAPDAELYQKSPEEIAAFKSAQGLPSDKKIFLYLGSTMWYDIPALLKMLTFVPGESVLVLAGLKEGEKNGIELAAKKLGVENRVIMFGRINAEEVPMWHLSADILLNPLAINYAGSVSSKVYEYLAAGKPIISSPGGANEEVLNDRENALIAAEPFAENFAAAAKELLENPDLARQIAEHAKEDARKYTWEVRARSIVELLKKL